MYASSDEEEDEELSSSECTSSSSEESSELTTTSEDEDDEDSEPSSSSENEDEAEDSGEFDSSSSSSSSSSSASSFSSDSTADSAEERPALLIPQHHSKHKGGLLPRIKLSATGGGIPAGDGGGGGGGAPGEGRRYSSPDLASVARGLRSSPPLSEEQRHTFNRRGSAHSAREGARLAVETENSLLDENSEPKGRTKRFSFSISRMRSDTPPKQRSGSFTLMNQKHKKKKKKKMHKSKQVMNEDDVKEKAAEGEEPGADKLPELQMETVIQGYMENEKKNKKRTKKERKKKKVKKKTAEKTKQKKKTGEQERHSRGSDSLHLTDKSLHCSNDSSTKASKDGLRSLLVTPRKGLLKKKGKTRSNNSSNNVDRKRKKGAPSFCLYKVQQLGSEQWHKGAIWALKFNADGSYMASGGNDCIVRVWKVEPHEGSKGRLSQYVQPNCVRTFVGHEADILDISWSNNDFLLSASMDNTVRLWHTSCEECVSCFNHQDFVTSVSFHPLNNKTFISGGLDGKLSLWNIARKIVISQAELPCMVTAACFTKPRGHQVIVGTESGKLLVYSTKDALAAASPRRNEEMRELELVREVSVNSRRGHGKKITGIQVSRDGRYVLVTANDALIRLYNSKDYSLVRTFAGCVSKEFQISAAFSNDEKYIISGSEDRHSFLWENTDPFNKKNCNTAYESFRVHEQMAPVAIFAPPVEGLAGEVIVTAGLDGSIAFLHGVPSSPDDQR